MTGFFYTRTLATGMMAGLILSGLGLNQARADDRDGGRAYPASYTATHGSYKANKPHKKARKGRGRTAYAKVVEALPIYRTVAYRVPHQQCWTESVRYEVPSSSYRSTTPVLVGTIIGAAIGNNLGRGHHADNRAIKTVAGGLLGASIGRDISTRSQPLESHSEYREEERCSTEYRLQREERLEGYDVTYRYRGETYHTRMDYDPGDKIPVNVQVRPVF